MNEINCDIEHVLEAIVKMQESDDIDSVLVWKTHCTMRGISQEEMQERNILPEYREQVVRIEEQVHDNFKFKFHQNQIDDFQEFCFTPPGVNEIDPQQYHTPVGELGENLKKVVEELESEYSDLMWDLGKIEGGSIAQAGHVTDFEFEFEVIGIR